MMTKDNWLRIKLPSGHYLCYAAPRVDDTGQVSYMGVDSYSKQWRRIKTHGGKLFNNITQSSARDVMTANMPAINRTYPIVLTIHDELITECSTGSAKELARMMATVPQWAQGLPLAADGFECTRYAKH
jgi:DNA polymerase